MAQRGLRWLCACAALGASLGAPAVARVTPGKLAGTGTVHAGTDRWSAMGALRPPSAMAVHVYLIAANLFFYQAIRQALGFLVVAMSAEYGFTHAQKGWLLAAPSVGAICTQLLGGATVSLIVDRL